MGSKRLSSNVPLGLVRHFRSLEPAMRAAGYRGHDHFWDRAISRRTLFRTAAGASAAAMTAGMWSSVGAHERTDVVDPRPIPGGITYPPDDPEGTFIHVFFPDPQQEPSTITDFIGFVGAAHITGTGTQRRPDSGRTRDALFAADVRFMKGFYIGVDHQPHTATFGFI